MIAVRTITETITVRLVNTCGKLKRVKHLLEWRNWQTHGTQNPASFTGYEGSTPSSSTTDFRDCYLRQVLITVFPKNRRLVKSTAGAYGASVATRPLTVRASTIHSAVAAGPVYV